MQYRFSRQFKKHFAVLPQKIKEKAIQRLEIFVQDPFDATLNNHALRGDWYDCRSINITPDIRAIYRVIERDTAYFVAIGSHSKLYR
jgi:mRNA interferase YafQ